MPSCGVHQTSQSANRGLREWHTVKEKEVGGEEPKQETTVDQMYLWKPTVAMHVNAKCASQASTYVCMY